MKTGRKAAICLVVAVLGVVALRFAFLGSREIFEVPFSAQRWDVLRSENQELVKHPWSKDYKDRAQIERIQHLLAQDQHNWVKPFGTPIIGYYVLHCYWQGAEVGWVSISGTGHYGDAWIGWKSGKYHGPGDGMLVHFMPQAEQEILLKELELPAGLLKD